MASPWQFSPYLPSLSKCSAARSQWQRALRHVFGKTALAAIRDCDPEPALLEPYADRKARVQVVIDHQDVTHDPPPLRIGCGVPATPREKRDGLSLKRPAGFCLANQRATAFPRQITDLSALHSVYGKFHNLIPSRR
jgi:hypothetical protein